jgi:hypothetical protein
VSTLQLLDTGCALDWFRALPQQQQLRSLGPDFARADLQRAEGHRCVHAGYAEGNSRWLHTVHLRPLGDGQSGAISPYGYGGPLCNDEDPGFLRRAWKAWQAWCVDAKVLGEFCRFHPEAPQHRFFGGEVSFNRDTVSVDLTLPDLQAQYNSLARRKLRKAAGVEVRWSRAPEVWRAFGDFYRRAMSAAGASASYLFADDYFAELAVLEGVELCICEADSRWLSAAVYLFQRGQGGVVEYHLGASSAQGHERGTPYLLQHAAALEGARRGLASLYLGGGSSAAPDNSLLFYKRCFSRRSRPFHIGRAVHHEALFTAFAKARGYDRQSAPPNLLFETPARS